MELPAVWYDNKAEIYKEIFEWRPKVCYVVVYYGHGWLKIDGLPIEIKPPITIVFCDTKPEKIEHE